MLRLSESCCSRPFPAQNPRSVPVPRPPPAAGAGDSLLEAVASVRAFAFYVVTFALALPLFLVMAAIFVPVWLLDRDRRRAMHFVNNVWANLSTLLFYPIEGEPGRALARSWTGGPGGPLPQLP